MDSVERLAVAARSGAELPGELAGCRAVPQSVHETGGVLAFIARSAVERFLVVAGSGLPAAMEGVRINAGELDALRCPLSPANARALMELFPFVAPSANRDRPFSMGLGDRLGLASPGHLEAIAGKGIFPVLAQQSMRELKLTGRSYEQVVAAAAFAVFQQDWREGWGADGDHLKTAEEIRTALDCGCTMITLDCSEQMGGQAGELEGSRLDKAYQELPEPVRSHYEKNYLGRAFSGGLIGPGDVKAIALTYGRVIEHAADIYHNVIAPWGKPVDFEVSIDETATPTTPAAHFVVASELAGRGVAMTSMAPRFIGEFQKGIDYIGDPSLFERDFIAHAQIARQFGYRLSIHSGSDKFAVFGAIGRHTGLRVHVKTAGTSWLEALRVVARKDAALFREMLAFAMETLPQARAYYHISADPARVAPPETVADAALEQYLDQPDARQILHITYGLLLQAQADGGADRFRGRLFALLHRHEAEYREALRAHIGRHADVLMGQEPNCG